MSKKSKKDKQDKKGWYNSALSFFIYSSFFFIIVFTFAFFLSQLDILPLSVTESFNQNKSRIVSFLVIGNYVLLCLELMNKGFLAKLFGKKNEMLALIAFFLFLTTLFFWYFEVWIVSKGDHKAEAFSSLMSALAFFGLIGTITVQIYVHRKSQEMELKKMRGEYIAKHERHTEIREEVLKKVREASSQGKYIEEIFSNRGELKSRLLSVNFEDELGLRNSPQTRSERKIHKSQDIG